MAAADRRRRWRRYDACRAAAMVAAVAAAEVVEMVATAVEVMVVATAASLGGATVELPPQFDWRHRPAPTAVVTLRDACAFIRSRR